jgi:hypothetical protein
MWESPPDAEPDGILQVIVNGVIVISDGKAFEDRTPGKIIRQTNKDWTL